MLVKCRPIKIDDGGGDGDNHGDGGDGDDRGDGDDDCGDGDSHGDGDRDLEALPLSPPQAWSGSRRLGCCSSSGWMVSLC